MRVVLNNIFCFTTFPLLFLGTLSTTIVQMCTMFDVKDGSYAITSGMPKCQIHIHATAGATPPSDPIITAIQKAFNLAPIIVSLPQA